MAWLNALWHRLHHHPHPPPQQHPHPHPHHSRPAPPSKRSPPPTKLLSLPDDVLLEIVRHVTHTQPNPTQPTTVEHASFAAAQGLILSCRKLCSLFYLTLDSLSLSHPSVTDHVLSSLAARSAPVMRRLVLRGSPSLTNYGLLSLARASPMRLRSLDLSFIASVDDAGVSTLLRACAPRLEKLLLRQCAALTDRTLAAVAGCTSLHTLDVSYCPRITDAGMALVSIACGSTLRLLSVAHDTALTDATLVVLAKECKNMEQLCGRGLPYITDVGFAQLCQGIGDTVEGIDVTLCPSLTRDSTLRAIRTHCRHIYPNMMSSFSSRSLRQIIVSTLRQNIFIVHGTDPVTRRDTVHTVLIDNGDIVSASLLSSGTTDLSMLGIVLCKSYGSVLNLDTKKMLENDYGIPSSSLMD